jgi:hypothetical protein
MHQLKILTAHSRKYFATPVQIGQLRCQLWLNSKKQQKFNLVHKMLALCIMVNMLSTATYIEKVFQVLIFKSFVYNILEKY